MEGIDLFVKILVFVKILSQDRRKEEEEFQSLEVREQTPSHLKTIPRTRIFILLVLNKFNELGDKCTCVSAPIFRAKFRWHAKQ